MLMCYENIFRKAIMSMRVMMLQAGFVQKPR